jgi:NitT/TauT family transport system substrate-binding protein
MKSWVPNFAVWAGKSKRYSVSGQSGDLLMRTVSFHRLHQFVSAVLVCLAGAVVGATGPTYAEHVKVGVVRLANPIYLGIDKRYFAREDLDVELVFFDVATTVALGVVSGDLDFGLTGLTAGFYNLAGQGGLKIIGGGSRISPTFNDFAVVVSNRAYAAGLRSIKDLPGHSVAISQFGTPVHYGLTLLAEKYGLDLKTMRLMPLQSNPNQVSAVVGGSADAAVIPAAYILPALEQQQMKLLAWVGDEVSWQNGVAFTSSATAAKRGALVERFLRAYANSVKEYRAAFSAGGDKRSDGESAPEAYATIAKYIGTSPQLLKNGIQDSHVSLNIADIERQISTFRAQGMLKGEIPIDLIVERRYVKVGGEP